MSRSIVLVSIACAMVWMGCNPAGTRNPARDAGTTMPREDVGLMQPPDVGMFVIPDVGPRPDGGAADTDEDGIPDALEPGYMTDPNNADTDGDGVPDGVELLAMRDPTDPGSTIPATDFYVILPYNDPEQHKPLDFTARLGRGDVYFVVDTTASMGLAINSVRNSLRDTIVPMVSAAIADVVMGVGDYRDYPEGTRPMSDQYGETGDWTFRNRQSMTADTMAVQTALGTLAPGGGGDEPEAGGEALYQAVAGTCADGSGFGAACFRSASHPIVVLVTDAHLHNGPTSSYNYVASRAPGMHSWTETVAAFTSNNVHTVGVAVPLAFLFPAQGDLNAMAMATNSYNSSGMPTVYRAMMSRVGEVVVSGIVDLVSVERQDVSARSLDDTSDSVDATQFITAIRPDHASRPVTGMDATTFFGVPGGTTVTFDVTFVNTTIPEQGHPQLYQAFIEVFDVASGTALDRRNVYIVIPAMGGSILI